MSDSNRFEGVVFSYSTNVNYLEEENRQLKDNIDGLQKEIEKFKKVPLLACEVRDIVDERILIRLANGNEFLVESLGRCGPIYPGDLVLVEQKNLTVVQKVGASKRFDVEKFIVFEKPDVSWNFIGGLKEQENEIKEVIELPLLKPELFKQVGITPPKGILLYGPPGTGKTLLAKAVAKSTNSNFIEIVGSELVQKFIGEGAKLVKDIFQMAREKAPSIVFIDEIDAIASRRVDIGTSGEREVQRTFMQLLSEIDGFKPLDNVKVIGCTNRMDILDDAVTRPGRLDRLIKVPLPNEEGIKEIFKIHTKNMSLDNVDVSKLIPLMKSFSGAEIKSVATEAGYFAIREDRTKVTEQDFVKAIEKVARKEKEDLSYKRMFN